jgi:polar amino acid transport system permease protein
MDLLDTFFNWPILRDALPSLLRGLGVTVLLGLSSIALGFITGLAVALLRLYGPGPVRTLARLYVDLFRSMPLLVLLVLVYYALPFLGIRLSSFAAATTALSLVACAYTAEILRAGMEAVPKGQFEAAAALGLGFAASMRYVVLPQALRMVTPPLTSNCINVLKDTALASVVAMPELLKEATQAQATAANPTPLIGAAVLYLALLLPLVRLVGSVEARHRALRS